jgi:tannase/feruloyl esterase
MAFWALRTTSILRSMPSFAAFAAAGSLAVLLQAQTPAPQPESFAPLVAATAPSRSCESLLSLTLSNTTIDSASVDEADKNNPTCRVTATVTHPPAGDRVRIFLAFPLKNWNGRFEGVGGGGFSGGSPNGVRGPAAQGFAAGSTDTGHEGASGSFALDANGRLTWQLIRDNAYLGIHEMTVTGKALTQAFYGTPAPRAYFNGCSTGGRQGLMEAQRYPDDYDGIVAGAPAINWTRLHPEQLWGSLVMLEAKNFLPMCKFTAAAAAATAACDEIDGVKDGVIEDPARCTYDPNALVGTTSGDCGVFTRADADVIRKIWEGPKRQDGSFLWYGLTRGADFGGLSGTQGNPPQGRPNPITLEWFRFFLTQNPQWDWTTITRGSYEQFWEQSVEEFSDVIATDNPDLSAFKNHGGKIVMWHGQSDQLIYPGGSIDYYNKVVKQLGGAARTSEFFRFFLAPGVAHCGGGSGPAPAGQLAALVKWVENGIPPETLTAIRRDASGGVARSRPLCQYPLVARYKGKGSTDDAASFECRSGF